MGQIVRRARQGAGMGLGALAAQACMTHEDLEACESPRAWFTREQLARIGHALDRAPSVAA